MDTLYELQIRVNDKEAKNVKALTSLPDVSLAIVELVTLAGRGEIQIKPSMADYAAALKESMKDEAAGRMRTFKTAAAATVYFRRKLGE